MKKITTVNFEAKQLESVDHFAKTLGKTRSWAINRIMEEYLKVHHVPAHCVICRQREIEASRALRPKEPVPTFLGHDIPVECVEPVDY